MYEYVWEGERVVCYEIESGGAKKLVGSCYPKNKTYEGAMKVIRYDIRSIRETYVLESLEDYDPKTRTGKLKKPRNRVIGKHLGYHQLFKS